MALMVSWTATSQFVVSGEVKDGDQQPLVGANVLIVETNLLTVTDDQGNFTFPKVPTGTYTLKVSFVGFEGYQELLNVASDVQVAIDLRRGNLLPEEVLVYATRANRKTPTTYSNVSKEQIEERNLGQDLPILLKMTPSIVTTSDAGAGIGYTAMRIRGSDATRINVTMNGIPVNDSESHGVFWVNMPNLSSSTSNIQIQRGVGTSSNGAASFGATVNLQTSGYAQEPRVSVDNSVGSFNTWKTSAEVNTGLIKDKFNFETRISKIVSDGYIDRSSADLKSYYISGGFYGKRTLLKAIVFGGREVTQQAWYGTPEARLTGNQEDLQNVIDLGGEYGTQEQIDNLLNSDRRFNYYLYDNEVDNYAQDHLQLHVSQSLSDYLEFSGALHYTYGRGYFEQFREDDEFSAYGLSELVFTNDTIRSGDFVRRRWLDNDFYGLTYSFNYSKNDWDVILGGGWNKYDGDHFGEIVWAEFAGTSGIRDRYYEGIGEKTDFNAYLKVNRQIGQLNLYGDAQARLIDYSTIGVDNDLTSYDTGGDYQFFNPKLGFTYSLSRSQYVYASYAVANREPVRSDFIDALDGETPEHETLHNVEAGVRKESNKFGYNLNFYLMKYRNQLVPTGELNDVGSAIRANVPDSYRAGIELVTVYRLTDNLIWNANATISQNKIRQFNEIVYDYGANAVNFLNETTFSDTDISFSPNVIAGSDLKWTAGNFTMQWLSKYIGAQFLDNTSNDDRAIDAYFVNDLNFSYLFRLKALDVQWNLLINNVLDTEYESNGYTWGFMLDGSLYQQNNYYPQAGINFLTGVSIQF